MSGSGIVALIGTLSIFNGPGNILVDADLDDRRNFEVVGAFLNTAANNILIMDLVIA